MPAFPEAEWFLALGRLMAAEGEEFRRLGYAETQFTLRVIDNDSDRVEATVGLEFDGYTLIRAESVDDLDAWDPDFILNGRRATWLRMLEEIARNGRPEMRHTLSSLALMGEELWLESHDQLREDKFFRFNQTLQEFFNLAAKLPR